MSCVINSTGRWRSISACASAIGAERFSLLSRDRRELPDDRAGLISRSADAAAATAFFAACRYYGSLWLTLTPPADAQLAGDFPLTLRLLDAQSGEALAEAVLTLHLVPAALPPQTLLHTEWLHTDCLADYYRLAVFSPDYWRAVRHFVRCAVHAGVNMLLTPLFTPPLDTAVGGERTTVQLVRVTRSAQGYGFDFSRLAQWVALAQEEGIEHFEIAPLFTQWGAAHAPRSWWRSRARRDRFSAGTPMRRANRISVSCRRCCPN